ncbi:MAG TPA: alpha/beta hydrolase [Vicinamibacterales bacterium]|nr:alpha/beta hydrolase [Vicinamibacterales bacterium]
MRSSVAHLSTSSVRYLEAGSGRALVLLHAFPLSAEQWLPQLARVPPGWRFVAPDLRGFGGAEPGPVPGGISMDTYAGDVIELMAHLEIPSAVVAGLSMGGYVAFAIARRAPARVAGLVLADTRAAADTADGRAARDRMLAIVARDGPAGVAREMLPKLLGDTTRRDQPDLVDAVQRLIEHNAPDGIAAAIRAMKDRPDSTAMLSSFACPVTVICGEEDVITTVAENETMHRAIAGSRFVRIAAAGHLSNLENPAAFTTALTTNVPDTPGLKTQRPTSD